MPANEVEALVRKELSGLSQQGVVATMKMKKWSPVQVRGAGEGGGGRGDTACLCSYL